MRSFYRYFCSQIAEVSQISYEQKQKAVARWLLAGVGIIIVQILLGGITRLTGSGLSITEWKPIMGVLPPLSENDWQIAFDKYKQIAQYKYLNAHFTLSDFKQIFMWEWLHREWARVVLSFVFIIGFVYFFAKNYFNKKMVFPFVILFILGGLQGAIGWIMVKSGLNDTDLYVSHIRLAVHFIAALVLLCYTLWFALMLLVPERRKTASKPFFRFTVIVIALLGIQLTYGAFMAGLKAATAAPTWPSVNAHWLPGDFHSYGNRTYSGLTQYLSHPIAVHFMHRTFAYLLTGLIIAWFFVAGRYAGKGSLLEGARKWPLVLVILQVLLGIFTVLNATNTIAGHFGTFEYLAEAHQLVAMFLLMAMVVNLYGIRPKVNA